MAEIVTLIVHELLNTATPVELIIEHMNILAAKTTKEVR